MEEKKEDVEQIQKPKKPRSEKQIESFIKARQVRTEKSLLKKEKIKEIKDTINSTPLPDLIAKKPEEVSIVKPKKQPKVIDMPPDESSSKRKSQRRKQRLLFMRVVHQVTTIRNNQDNNIPEIINQKKLFINTHKYFSFRIYI